MRIIPDSVIWLTVMLIFSPSILLVSWICFNGWRHERGQQQDDPAPLATDRAGIIIGQHDTSPESLGGATGSKSK